MSAFSRIRTVVCMRFKFSENYDLLRCDAKSFVDNFVGMCPKLKTPHCRIEYSFDGSFYSSICTDIRV